MNDSTEINGLEIAVIGMSGRYARSKNLNEFWQNLIDGIDLTSIFPTDKTDEKDIKAGSILEDIDLFDADFFGMNPREAEITDPQHRIFLECAWEALENAGYNTEIEKRPIGVYAGISMGTYAIYNLYNNPEIISSTTPLQRLIGSDKDYVPTRISYKLNLKGPSVSIGTACSSSLVSVHLACQSLLSGECDMALAGGVAVKTPQNELTLSPVEIISKDGHCRPFDAKANGTLGGNGIGVVVLKRLEEAIADRDTIYAVIKGSAINNDGDDKIGYPAPSEKGQKKVIQAAQIMAEVEPETISYIEAHGTGTPLGDPIEIAALTGAFQSESSQKGYCAIGSVKSNIGHLDGAAGITGFIKTVMALKHKVLPPSIKFEAPNPQIDFDNSPFFVNTKLSEWETNGTPRRAGVSSFGIGGTNAHVILEEAPDVEVIPSSRKHQLLLLSARTPSALETATENLVNHLKDNTNIPLADVAYTLQVGRKAFAHRRIVVTTDIEDTVKVLDTKDPQRIFSSFNESNNCPVVFMFTGQGAQYVNMAREIYETEVVFREEYDRCRELLKPHLDLDIYSLSDLNPTSIAQPALFIIEYALAKLWMSWGVYPAATIGHSIGEYVAATLAGVFSLEDALKVVATRGRLMQQRPPGAMLSVSLSASEVESLLAETKITGVELAANNAPSLSVVSGSLEAIAELENMLMQREINCRRLHTSHAFHSQMMDAIVERFTAVVKKVNLNPPQIPFISNVTGTWITNNEAINPTYWARHLRQPVRFADGIGELLKDSEQIFLEVGPGRTLATFVRKQAGERLVLTSLRHPKDEQSDTEFFLNTLGKLWLAGVKVDWLGFSTQEERCRIPLPTYPFERQRYWVDAEEGVSPQESGVRSKIGHLLKKPDIADWFYVPSWKHEILPSVDFSERKRWLVFVDDSEFCSAFCERLSLQYGAEVIQVKRGDKFHKIQEGVYTINPEIQENYEILLNEVLELGNIQNISHFWSLIPAKNYEEYQKLGFYSLLYLAQVLNSKTFKESLQIGVISSNLQKVTGSEKIIPEKATILGACKVIPQELFNVNCCSIDIEESDASGNISTIKIDRLITELVVNFSASAVAYRGGRRWVETFEPITLEPASKNQRLREKGVYLITGGMGGIGVAIAEYLAETVQAKLVLIGRSDFPPKSEWENLLKTGDNNGVIDKIQKLQKLEKFGAEVLTLQADVANKEQMQTAVNQVYEKFGNIHGVIHAAGTIGQTENKLKTPETVEKIFAPKIKGTLVIDEIFRDTKLDFLIFWSSLSSIIGGFGQIDYAGANAFLDIFANRKSENFTVSINWDTWQEVGMAANIKLPEKYQKQHEENLKQAIANREGIEVFSRILQGNKLELNNFSQVVVSTKDFPERIKQSYNLKSKSKQTLGQEQSSKVTTLRPNLTNAYVKPRNEMEEKVATIFEMLIGIEKVGIYDNFFELGGDSLLATQLNSRLKEIFQVEISIEEFFDAPTVGEICQKIQDYQSKGETVKTQIILPVDRQAYQIKLTE
ncbi:MAG: SDR family NAD(P)-dependent oxidoreductase [Okeania sp. SIO2G4]|uniref:type I polyketide synthase n=1 Tax=unclassified Okeania TaxID=2634635 RepID=UPI0013BC8213|nr:MULTISPECIES: type I polyketide synthase [unclassified Okeania]NEP72547.1 SDR family NAD(P)-dependent oxidoreductase [Okeania sp. SIO2G5]NEP94139.1 SDR family NAD(P)-dependent oxidoreductase [Okeania sp. SIO2F5]NEQ91256.1 SDR family NAD(P)-dependent oxidoreductase [Okeania sp. SIO2G4]